MSATTEPLPSPSSELTTRAGDTSLRSRHRARSQQLGLLRVGLGAVQLARPAGVASWLGVARLPHAREVVRVFGFGDALAGLAQLREEDRLGAGSWAGVLSDGAALVFLTGALTSKSSAKARLLAGMGLAAGLMSLATLNLARRSRSRRAQKLGGPIHVVKSVTINRPLEVVYQFWRDFRNLPQFMAHLEAVQVSDGTSRWRAKAPAGLRVEWEAEVVLDRPNEVIGWRSLEGASVPNRGAVRFKPAPGNRGTEVHVELKYDAPGGAVGAALAKLFGEEPALQIAGDLRRLKQVLETGSVVHSDASIHSGLHAAVPERTPPFELAAGEQE